MIGSALPLGEPLTTTIIEPNQGGAVEVGKSAIVWEEEEWETL